MFMWFNWALLAATLGVALLGLGVLVSKLNKLSREPVSPLECGFSSMSDSRQPVSLRFFIFAVIFVIFDIELIIVVPLLSSPLGSVSTSWFFIVLINLLSLGLLFEWASAAFEWLKFAESFSA